MADRRRASCRRCRRHRSEVGPISWGGYCGPCGIAAYHNAADQIHYHVGPEFHYWRRKMAESVGAVLADDQIEA